MDIRALLDYEIDTVPAPAPEVGSVMRITLILPNGRHVYEGSSALGITDVLSSLLSEYEQKAIALDIEEGNYG